MKETLSPSSVPPGRLLPSCQPFMDAVFPISIYVPLWSQMERWRRRTQNAHLLLPLRYKFEARPTCTSDLHTTCESGQWAFCSLAESVVRVSGPSVLSNPRHQPGVWRWPLPSDQQVPSRLLQMPTRYSKLRHAMQYITSTRHAAALRHFMGSHPHLFLVWGDDVIDFWMYVSAVSFPF